MRGMMGALGVVVGLVCASSARAADDEVAVAIAEGTSPGSEVEPADRPVSRATPHRIVAVGDLHGDLQNSLRVLFMAGIVDERGHWAGGTTTFVQTGDVTDRGPDSGALIELMRRLEREAPAAGGVALSLMGNHEAMNVMGDWRYVHPADVRAYGGVEARREAFSAQGPHGAWIRQQDGVGRVADTIFVHGGITPPFAERGVDVLNDQIRAGLSGGLVDVQGPEGPLWYRGYVLNPEDVACPALTQALSLLGAARMVVGHTVQRDGVIKVRCGGRLAVIDVGISRAYGGRLAAWEWVDGDARAITTDGVVDLEDPAPPAEQRRRRGR